MFDNLRLDSGSMPPAGAAPGGLLLARWVRPAGSPVMSDGPLARARLFVPPPGQVWRSYYYAGGQRIAMRVEGAPSNNGVFYLLTDHLGSTSVTADANGNPVSVLRYSPYGQTRYTSGVTPTTYRYTGQRSDESSTGLYFYGARYYSSLLGRFISADTIVPEPDNPQSYNRFSYSYNNPLRYIDPSGHCSGDQNDPDNPDADCWAQINLIQTTFTNITIDPELWKTEELEILLRTLQGLYDMFGSDADVFEEAFGDVIFRREMGGKRDGGLTLRSWGLSGGNTVILYDGAFSTPEFYIAHEMAHVFDAPGGWWSQVFGGLKSSEFAGPVWPGSCFLIFSTCIAQGDVVSGTPVSGQARKNSAEDFAETFAAIAADENDWTYASDAVNPGDLARRDIVQKWIALTIDKK